MSKTKNSEGPFQRQIYAPQPINLSRDTPQDLSNYVHKELTAIGTQLNRLSSRFNQLVPQVWLRPPGDTIPMPSAGTWYRMEVTELASYGGLDTGVYDDVNHRLVFGHVGIAIIGATAFMWRDRPGNAQGSSALMIHPADNGVPFGDNVGYDLRYADFSVGGTVNVDTYIAITRPPQTYYVLGSHNNNQAVDMVDPVLSIAYLR